MPWTALHETEAAAGGPLDRWLSEKEGRENRKNHT
jgi:hypothetical protein